MSTSDLIARAPKALLHDHLDGGLRPLTVVELASEYGYDDLPTTDPEELAHWFNRGRSATISSCISRPSPTRAG